LSQAPTDATRRHVLAALLAVPFAPLAPPPAIASSATATADAAVAAVLAESLLASIPAMPFGAPATNATLPSAQVADLTQQTLAVERAFDARNVVNDKNLNGSWRLLYSDGREITSLAAGFPGGFELGPTYQPIDLASGRFENQGNVVNRFGLAKLSTCVVGDVSVAPMGGLNAVGSVNERNNRVDVTFRRITFQLDEVAGRPTSLRKVLVPNIAKGAAQPANDVTYLDERMRIVRGGDGALFIFAREESPRPLLTTAERSVLYADSSGVDVTTGTGKAEDSAPPELKRLLQDR